MQNMIDNYTVEITQSTDSSEYPSRLAASIKHMKDSVTKRMIRDMLYGVRVKGGNEYVHGTTVSERTAEVERENV